MKRDLFSETLRSGFGMGLVRPRPCIAFGPWPGPWSAAHDLARGSVLQRSLGQQLDWGWARVRAVRFVRSCLGIHCQYESPHVHPLPLAACQISTIHIRNLKLNPGLVARDARSFSPA